jgi:hypothetical protein
VPPTRDDIRGSGSDPARVRTAHGGIDTTAEVRRAGSASRVSRRATTASASAGAEMAMRAGASGPYSQNRATSDPTRPGPTDRQQQPAPTTGWTGRSSSAGVSRSRSYPAQAVGARSTWPRLSCSRSRANGGRQPPVFSIGQGADAPRSPPGAADEPRRVSGNRGCLLSCAPVRPRSCARVSRPCGVGPDAQAASPARTSVRTSWASSPPSRVR